MPLHKRFVRVLGSIAAAGVALVALSVSSAPDSRNLVVVPKWGRFEQALKSTFGYTNALQQASLTVTFTSPLAESFEVPGFWDGGRTWRFRFAPDQPGRWTFQTTCSDTLNQGLHQVTGEFLCTAPSGTNRFSRHGPLRVARDGRRFEHADRTPFFWLSDTTWTGAIASSPKDWQVYTRTRAEQMFTVVQWGATSAIDPKRQAAFTGTDNISINLDFFQRLDLKVETAQQAGLLSSIAPWLELEARTDPAAALPDNQAGLLARYAVARWGADPVAWLVAVEGDAQAKRVPRWKRIGQMAFAGFSHGPVVLYPGETNWLLDEFRVEPWVEAFGYESACDVSDDALRYTLIGPAANEWKKLPTRPLIGFGPCESGFGPQARNRISADDVRRAAYWSLLLSPPAGFSYAARAVQEWDQTVEPGTRKSKSPAVPAWQTALFTPAAGQMTHLAALVSAINLWPLRPQPDLLAAQPGTARSRSFITAAGVEKKELSLIYSPQEKTIELQLDGLPRLPRVTWINPRTGERNPAVAVVTGRICHFAIPEPGDWLLMVSSAK